MQEVSKLKRSFEPIFSILPYVKAPAYRVPLKEKLKWTGIVLILYYLLTQIPLYGLSPTAVDQFAQLRAVIAGSYGSILTLGIGPIVTASIVLQLLVGGKILRLDLSRHEDRAFFQSFQKLLSIIFVVLEGGALIVSGALPPISQAFAPILLLQIVIGGILVIYLDEVVSKWGLGSGVGLFIAAGVSQAIIVGAFNPFPSPAQPGVPAGRITGFIYLLATGQMPDFQTYLLPVISLIFVFLVVVYAESMRVEIPIAHGGGKYLKVPIQKYPIKFLYPSNMPVILTSALLVNLQMIAMMFQKIGHPILGIVERGRPISGLVYYLSPPRGIDVLLVDPAHALIYGIVFISLCIVFAWFWVEVANLGPRDLADQLYKMGIKIPGFRGSKRHIERILNRYIPPLTILGGAFVGFLAFGADLTGSLGGGTGVLLTVGILHNLYEEIAREQMMELHPALRRFFK